METIELHLSQSLSEADSMNLQTILTTVPFVKTTKITMTQIGTCIEILFDDDDAMFLEKEQQLHLADQEGIKERHNRSEKKKEAYKELREVVNRLREEGLTQDDIAYVFQLSMGN